MTNQQCSQTGSEEWAGAVGGEWVELPGVVAVPWDGTESGWLAVYLDVKIVVVD